MLAVALAKSTAPDGPCTIAYGKMPPTAPGTLLKIMVLLPAPKAPFGPLPTKSTVAPAMRVSAPAVRVVVPPVPVVELITEWPLFRVTAPMVCAELVLATLVPRKEKVPPFRANVEAIGKRLIMLV